jgi:hypothetical protein
LFFDDMRGAAEAVRLDFDDVAAGAGCPPLESSR